MNEPKHSETPIQKMMVSMSGVGTDSHDTDPPGADEVNIRAGHEPDKFEVRAILYVPAGVVVVLILTYLIVSGVFFNIRDPWTTPGATQQQIAYGELPGNEKLANISSWDENAPVKQPRLEGAQTSPSENRYPDLKIQLQQVDKNEVNSFPYTPQYLRPKNYWEPITKSKTLIKAETVTMGGKSVRRITIDDAMEQTAQKLKVRKDPVKVLPYTPVHTSMTNGGQILSRDQKELQKKHPVTPE